MVVPGSRRSDDRTDAIALSLRLGERAAISGATAMRLGGWAVPDQELIVWYPGPERPGVGGVTILRDDVERSVVTPGGLRAVARADALVDLIIVVDSFRGRALLDHALQRRWVTAEQWEQLVLPRLGHGRRGAARLRTLADSALGGAHSEAERGLQRILGKTRLGGWQLNWVLRDGHGRPLAELDAALPELKICIEVDGLVAHSGRSQFERDRRRQNALILDGWLILRFTWKQLIEEPERVLREILRAVASRSQSA